MNKQHGGTLLGLMIGVVLGLAVALAVAVYITKTPPSFVNKGLAHTAESDANDTKKNKDWDPNAALYGKNPAKPMSPTSPATAAATGVATPPVVAGSLASSAPASKAPSPANSSDPLGDLVKAKSEAKSSNQAVDPFMYFVQAGAYRTAEDAETQRARLSLAGVDAKVTEREQAGRPVYRVRTGPFNKEAEAEQMKEKISATGADAALVRVQR